VIAPHANGIETLALAGIAMINAALSTGK